jgi:hypothetical protein
MKDRNQILKLLLIIFLITLGITTYLFTKSDIFSEDKPLKMKTLLLNGKEYDLDFYYVPSNATSQSYVQLRKKYKNGKDIIFENYERYQGVGKCKFMNDTTVMIPLLDTMSYVPRNDTVFVNLK